MKKDRLFGTDGVRGIANTEITPELAYQLGKAAAIILNKDTQKKPIFIVGADTRISGDVLSLSLISGLLSSGANVINVGILPTPAVAHLVRYNKATAGVMISASHNPYNYNGIKFFDSEGLKLPDIIEDKIQDLIENNFVNIQPYVDAQLGTYQFKAELDSVYSDFIINCTSTDLRGVKIALDCGNGATYKIAEDIFYSLGAHVSAINTTPNGININKNCGSTHMDQLKEFVLSENFDIGFAFDGDGDRCLAVDNHGNTITGDKILAICANDMKNKGTLKNNTVVATVMSNIGLTKAMTQNNINILHTKVGDRYVLEEMLKNGYNFGGEESGHIIFSDYNTTGDGLLTAVKLASICKEQNKTLSELSNIMTTYPQVLENIHVPNTHKNKILESESIKKIISMEETRLNGDGRILVRVSGTEPLIRVMVEGSNTNTIKNIANSIASEIKKMK